MKYRRVGGSGIKVSELSFGSWVTFGRQVDEAAAARLMAAAYEAGVNFFDNAEVYGYGESERIMGAALRKLGWSRDSYLVSSKVRWGSVPNPKPSQLGLSRKHIMEACDQALKRLGLETLDFYLCHRPDDEVPVGEIVRAMNDLVQMGKVHYWGTSEWPSELLTEAHDFARTNHLVSPTVEQPQYNLFDRERVEVEYAKLYSIVGIGLTTYSPLASGLLTGKYSTGIPDGSRAALADYGWLRQEILSDQGRERAAKVDRLASVARELDCTLPQLAIAWCLTNPNVSTVILGASNEDQLSENLAAAEVVGRLKEGVLGQIEAVLSDETS